MTWRCGLDWSGSGWDKWYCCFESGDEH